jgi:hypothetical protein
MTKKDGDRMNISLTNHAAARPPIGSGRPDEKPSADKRLRLLSEL